ncbi:MAG TPA: FAD-dependent oxidoreductase [Methylocella sp.]|nr:FAD-dependent oxidoreductase [Methylocella sp.]
MSIAQEVAITEMTEAQLDRNSTVAIIGAGQGGGETATLLRQNGFAGRILLIGDEPCLPYMRPPLSKAYLAREVTKDALVYKSAAAYEKAGVELRLGERVEKIDPQGKKLLLDDGAGFTYDKLVIATGGRARPLPVPGAGLRNILFLRSIADVETLQPLLVSGRRLIIVGGGYIGLEVAAVAVKRGLIVTVLESAPRVLARVTAPALSEFYERVHQEEGVDIRTGATVTGFLASHEDGAVGLVTCANGESFPADFVLIGIGLIPNTELATDAGLEVDDGIVVDHESRSSDRDIYAIGDCASHAHHGFLHRKIRLESVPNALEQARAVAASITGRPIPAATAPWFWSDQYHLKLQMVGLSDGYEKLVIRGNPLASSFIVFYLKADGIIAADAVNRPGEFMAAKRLVGERMAIDPARLADDLIPIKALMMEAAPA